MGVSRDLREEADTEDLSDLCVLAKGQEDPNRKVERLGQRKEDHEICMCIQES